MLLRKCKLADDQKGNIFVNPRFGITKVEDFEMTVTTSFDAKKSHVKSVKVSHKWKLSHADPEAAKQSEKDAKIAITGAPSIVVGYQVCTDKACLLPAETVLPITVSGLN